MTMLQIVLNVDVPDVPTEITATLVSLPARYADAPFFSVAFIVDGVCLDDEGRPLVDPA